MRRAIDRRHLQVPGSRLAAVKGGWDGPRGSGPPTVAFLSTFPPSRCGIGTFTRSLAEALARERGSGDGLGVIRLMAEGAPDDRDPRVVARVMPGTRGWTAAAAAAAADFEVLSIQHEYGIYGPDNGIALLDVLGRVETPLLTTLHTIPAQPSPRQRLILNELAARSDRLMVMAEVARDRLLELYRADPGRVVVIPHGAHAVPAYGGPVLADRRPVVLTWGLIGPGKGIETAIRALCELRSLNPPPLYLVCGQTHPNVLRAQGESYRRSLEKAARTCGVSHLVRFVPRYMDQETLSGYLSRADVVLLPYDSTEQVTSGVLVEALAAGKPVVSTAFPHAVELLAGGAGRVVPQRDAGAMAAALGEVLAGPGRDDARRAAREVGAALLWPAVACRYEAELQGLVERQPARER